MTVHLFAASKEFVIVTKRKGLAAAGVVALIAAGSAACGTAQATPQGKVQNAFTKLSDQKSVTLGLSFDATADQIYAVMKGDDFTRDDAAVLASLHASLSVSSSKQFSLVRSGDKGGAFDFALSGDKSGKQNLAEVRVVDQKFYLRADVKGLMKLDTSSSSASDLRDFNQFLDQADQLPSSLNSVKAALKGQWVVIDPKAFAEFGKSFADKMGGSAFGSPGDSSGSSSDSPFSALTGGGPKIDAKTQQQLVAAVKKAFAHNATYKDLGSKNGADHVQVTVPARQLAKDLSTSLTPVLKQIPGVKDSDLAGFNDVSGVPNRTIAIDVAIKGGSVSGITFDLAQLDTGTTSGHLPLALTLDDHADNLTAPAGAQQLNPQDLVGLFMADPSSSSSFTSSDFN